MSEALRGLEPHVLWELFAQIARIPHGSGNEEALAAHLARIAEGAGLTVTQDVAKAVTEAKAGKVEFRTEKGALIHAPVGKRSFGAEKLKQNIEALIDAIVKAKPAAAKGTYLKMMSISATMTPGIEVDVTPYA